LTRHLATSRIDTAHVPAAICSRAARVQSLWPAGESATPEALSGNDRSLVCLIEFAGRRVLLCSDIERAAQQEIMRRHPSLKADVVVAPHHGSTRTLDDGFLRQLGPSLLVCSCGRSDYERGRVITSPNTEPAPDGGHAALLVTARDGAVTIRIDSTGAVKYSAPGRP
jgi:competence protein ComEC